MNLRLLVNENIPRASVRRLRQSGLDVSAVAERRPGMSDDEVLEWAVREGRWLVTFDRD